MKYCSKNGLHWIEYAPLSSCKTLKHGTFLRYGGVSSAPFDSLNLSYKVGDDDANVKNNIEHIENTLSTSGIQFCNQVHGTTIYNLDENSISTVIPDADALVTSKPNKALGILHADCQAVIFFDPIKNVLCLAHAGWRGQASMFYTKIVHYLQVNFRCKPSDLRAAVSPSLGPYRARFDQTKDALSPLQKKHQLENKPLFNLWNAAFEELTFSGVLAQHIEVASICTYEHSGCYSYRRDKKQSGRMGTVAFMTS